MRLVLSSVFFYFWISVYNAIFCLSKTVAKEIVIRTKSGPVRGQERNLDSVPIVVFRNIPYAKPPIGDLRFELPQEVDPWLSTDDLKEHDEEISCPQPSANQNEKNAIEGQENCLLLDVYIRKVTQKSVNSNTSSSRLLPVLVYFHAGRFSTGSKNEYHPEFLLSLHDLIVVIPNYRLGVLGFLSNGGSKLPGNLGLFDQRMSLQWIHENIESFGGDKKRVTIAGHDAGGVSVGFHILSPLSHAISASGTALDPWAISRSSIPTVVHVSEVLNCSRNSSNSTITCLKKCNVERMLQVQVELKHIQFLPTVDKSAKHPFLPQSPKKLYQWVYQKNVTYLAGVTVNEASTEVSREFPKAVKLKHLDSIIQHLLRPYLKGSSHFHIIAKAAKYHYLRGAVIPTFESIEPRMEVMMSDFLYNSPLHITLELHSLKSPNTFMYVFNFENEYSPLGVSHMSDAFYLFNRTIDGRIPNHGLNTNAMREVLCNIWGQFVESKFPGHHSIWKRFRGNEMNYVEISETLASKTNYRKEAMEFWMLLIPDLKYYQNLSTEHPLLDNHAMHYNYTSWGIAGVIIIFIVLSVALAGTVTVTRRKYTQSSIIPTSSDKDHVRYSYVE